MNAVTFGIEGVSFSLWFISLFSKNQNAVCLGKFLFRYNRQNISYSEIGGNPHSSTSVILEGPDNIAIHRQ